jgi:hypothetical protein
VRAAAQVDEIALAVERHVLALRNRGDQFGLVVFADRLEEFDRLVARPDFARHREVLLRQFGHALLDGIQVFGRERTLAGEVVVEAVFDHRTDGHLRFREQLLHRISQQVRSRMAQDFQAVGILLGDDRQLCIALDQKGSIDQHAIDPTGDRRLGQAGADRGRNLGHRQCLRVLAFRSVRQGDHRHFASSRKATGRTVLAGNHAVRPAHQFREILSQRPHRLRHDSSLKTGGGIMDIDGFMESYKRAWETSDEHLLASLFAPDGTYRNTPFASQQGHEAIKQYWQRTKLQSDIKLTWCW